MHFVWKDWLKFLLLMIVWTCGGWGDEVGDSSASVAFSLVSEGWGACFSDESQVCHMPASQGSYLILLSLLFIYHVLSFFCFVVKWSLRICMQITTSKMLKVPLSVCASWCKMQFRIASRWGQFCCTVKETDCSSGVYDLGCKHIFFFSGSGSSASFCLSETYISKGRF